MVKKPASRQIPKRVRKRRGTSGVSVRIKRDQRFLQRLEQLGVQLNATNEALLAIFLELNREAQKPAELAFRFDAAVKTLMAAAFDSDDPDEWIAAARKAANL